MKATRTEIETEIYKRSFYEFSLEAFKVIHNGMPLIDNWHIKYLCNKVQERVESVLNGEKRDKHLLINVPPRTLKSELINVFLTAWIWAKKNDTKIISSSYSASLSLSLSVQARRLIESDWYLEHFDNVEISKDENTKGKFTTTNGGLRYCTSTGGTVTGLGGDVIIIDDPQNPQLARSEVERDNSNRFFNETLRSRLNNPAIDLFIVIMQRLHENDLTGMLLELEPDNWEHICLPAEVSSNVKPIDLKDNYINGLLFPQRLNESVLNGFKIGLGSYGYSGQYEQQPAPSDGGIIKTSWFEIVKEIPEAKIDFFLDTAYTSKQNNDPTAMIAVCKANNNLYVKKVSTVRMEFPELIKEIKRFTSENGYSRASRIYIEPKASGKSIVQQLKRETALNVVEDKAPTNDKISRVNSITPILESGRVFLLDGMYINDFLNECASFPNSKHDDMVDVLTMAVNKLMLKKGKGIKASNVRMR